MQYKWLWMLIMREIYRRHIDDSSKLWILRRRCLDSEDEHHREGVKIRIDVEVARLLGHAVVQPF